MLYEELLKGTQARENSRTFEQYQKIEAIYNDIAAMTKAEAYSLWRRTYGKQEKQLAAARADRLAQLSNPGSQSEGNRKAWRELHRLFDKAMYSDTYYRDTWNRCIIDEYGITWVLMHHTNNPNGSEVRKLHGITDDGQLIPTPFTTWHW